MTSTTPPTRDAEAETLQPFQWLRRIVVGSLITLALLLVLRLIAAHVAERRWQATAARLRAAGVALDITELQPPAIPNEQNTAWYLRQAAGLIDAKEGGPRSSNYTSIELGQKPPYNPLWHQLADASEQANVATFQIARRAREHTKVDWAVTYASPVFTILLPHLNGSRALANTLADGAERAFIEGDSAEGVERLRDIVHLSDALVDQPFTVTALVAAGIDGLAVQALSQHVSLIRIGNGAGEARPAAVRALIREMLRAEANADPKQALGARSVRVETAGTITAAHALEQTLWWARPTVMADKARVGERQLLWISAADASSNAARDAVIASIPPVRAVTSTMMLIPSVATATTQPIRVARPVTHTTPGAITPRMLSVFTHEATGMDVVAISLAVHLYEVEHDGDWPASLDALVPEDLPFVPRNKSAADDRPYGYELVHAGRPDGRDRPILMLDGKPRPATLPTAPMMTASPLDLSTWPTTQPSTEDVDQ